MKKRCLLAMVLLGAGSLPTVRAEGDEILGTWVAQTPIGRAHVKIVRNKNTYEGRITWLESAVFGADDPKKMTGQPLVDRENPNPSLRTRPVLGLKILKDLRYGENRQWVQGTIYDPERGKTYRCRVRLTEGNLIVRGFVAFPIFGRTTVWEPFVERSTPFSRAPKAR